MKFPDEFRQPEGPYFVEVVGKHTPIGDVFRRGYRGVVGSQHFDKFPTTGQIEGGEYSLCYRCKEPIIFELGHRIYFPSYDASSHFECVLKEQLKFGPIRGYLGNALGRG